MVDVEKLKQKILDLAIRGKLVPQDPNDEPASVLIEKIKAEKAKLVKEGKIKPSKEESYIYKGSDNFYYEKNEKIDFNEPLDVACNFVWLKGRDFLFPMETRKPKGETFQYIDIDSIDNKTNRIKYKEVKTENAPSRASRKVFKTSTLFSMVRPYLRNIAFVGKNNSEAIASTGFYVCTPFDFVSPKYLFLLMKSKYVVDGLNFYMKGDNSPSINGNNIENFLFPIPSRRYQDRIVEMVENIENYLELIGANINDLLQLVNKAKLKILDSVFGENSSYKSYYPNNYLLGDILEYEQPGSFIVSTTDYDNAYKTPVLTPGKTFILGYTDEKEGVYHVDSKVIIFDDFTTASRLVDFDFKVKSSAMKILHSVDENKFNIDYMYYLLQTIKVISDTHKRFWISEYAPKRICIHTYEEQLKIVDIIHSSFGLLDSII